jgi:opacity protein-like surface antigen
MKKTLLAISAFILLAVSNSMATDASKLWSSVSYKHKLTDNFYIPIKQEFRLIGERAIIGDLFNKDNCEIQKVRFNAGIGYKINDYFKLSAVARFSGAAYEYSRIEKQLLMNFYAKYKLPLDLNIGYRMRYQNVLIETKDNKEYFRNKLSLQWGKYKRVQPYVELEAIYRFSYEKDNETMDEFDEIRYCAGLEFDLPSKVVLDLFYMYQDDVNTARKTRTDAHVIGIGLSFD